MVDDEWRWWWLMMNDEGWRAIKTNDDTWCPRFRKEKRTFTAGDSFCTLYLSTLTFFNFYKIVLRIIRCRTCKTCRPKNHFHFERFDCSGWQSRQSRQCKNENTRKVEKMIQKCVQKIVEPELETVFPVIICCSACHSCSTIELHCCTHTTTRKNTTTPTPEG